MGMLNERTLVGERVVAVFEKADGPGDFDPLLVVTENAVYDLSVDLIRLAKRMNGHYVDSLPVILKGDPIVEVRVDEDGLAIEFGSGWIAQYYRVYDGERVWPRLAFFTPDEVKEWYAEYSDMSVMLTSKNVVPSPVSTGVPSVPSPVSTGESEPKRDE